MIAFGKVLAIVKICTERYCVVEVIGFCHHYFCHIVTKLDFFVLPDALTQPVNRP